MKSRRPVSLHSQLQAAALLGPACSLETGQGSIYSVDGSRRNPKTREMMPSTTLPPPPQPKVPCLETLPTAVVTDSKTSFPPAIPPRPPPYHPPPKPLLTLTPLKTKSKSKTQREASINCTLVSTTHKYLEHHNHQQCSC